MKILGYYLIAGIVAGLIGIPFSVAFRDSGALIFAISVVAGLVIAWPFYAAMALGRKRGNFYKVDVCRGYFGLAKSGFWLFSPWALMVASVSGASIMMLFWCLFGVFVFIGAIGMFSGDAVGGNPEDYDEDRFALMNEGKTLTNFRLTQFDDIHTDM